MRRHYKTLVRRHFKTLLIVGWGGGKGGYGHFMVGEVARGLHEYPRRTLTYTVTTDFLTWVSLGHDTWARQSSISFER